MFDYIIIHIHFTERCFVSVNQSHPQKLRNCSQDMSSYNIVRLSI